jgi:hypothetical protein
MNNEESFMDDHWYMVQECDARMMPWKAKAGIIPFFVMHKKIPSQ